MPETVSTLNLVIQAQAGDTGAVERLFTRYRDRLSRWAAGRLPAGVRGRLDTEDVVHDALTRTFERIGELDPRGGGFFQAYVRRAVLNGIRDQVARKRELLPPSGVVEQHAEPGPSPLEQVVGREVFERYEAALAKLDVAEREAVLARIEDHASWQEIADEFGKESPDAARMTVKRALYKVAKEMADVR
jgi:RNA polymerase sigma factor (sigma-70 family)